MSHSFILTLALTLPAANPEPSVAAHIRDLSSSNSITRSRAARELGASAHKTWEYLPHLAHALADADPFVARDAAEALGKVGPAAEPTLRRALQSADARVRLRALMALSRCCPRDRATVIALARALKTDTCPDVRRWAALTLDRIGLTGRGLIANLTAALADEDMSVRISAAVALGSYALEAREIAGRLVTEIMANSDGVLGTPAAAALNQIVGPAVRR